MIYDNECEELKSQINEQMLYMAASDAVDAVKEKIGGSTGSCSDELLEEINNAESETDTAEAVTDNTVSAENTTGNSSDDIESLGNSTGSAGAETTSKSSKKAKDPRDYTSSVSKEGMLLTVLLPLDAEVSNEKKVPSDVVSVASSWAAGVFNINTDFDSYRDLKKDVKKGNTWGNALSEKTELLVYESSVFNCFTKKDVNEETVLDCELEYLISGKRSDYENLESVCRKIIAIRFPLDMAYVVKDPDKIAVVKTISLPVAAITPFLTEPVLRYLIMAGWSYAEAMAETRNLLDGKKIDFVKTKENWITDLYDLSGSVEKSLNSDSGMEYKDYLLLLLAMQDDGVYYRMLDLMDINARQENSEFSMLNAAVGLGADFTVSYGDSEVSVHQSASYGE
jgi:hypothetical protein